MQIVIDIPEEVYKDIIEGLNITVQIGESLKADDTWASELIRNGVPLPKGHGRLGDLDALEKEMTNGINAGNFKEGYEEYAHINNMDDCVECVKYADTIIEADNEE